MLRKVMIVIAVLIGSCVEYGTTQKNAQKNLGAGNQNDANGSSIPGRESGDTNLHFPAPCVQCHESVRPPAPHDQSSDCVGCHSYPLWANAATFNHDPMPETCVQCHEKDRPAPPHDATGECRSCHTFPSFSVVVFNHSPKPESCESCHARPNSGVRAYPNQGPPANFDPNQPGPGGGHYLGKDCISCHLTPQEGSQSFSFNHSSPPADFCLPCHFNDGAGEHAADAFAELQAFGNCFSCHQNFDRANMRNWGTVNGAAGAGDD